MEKWFNVGKLVNTHGIKGEARIVSKTDFAEERYKPGNKLYLFMPANNTPIELTVKTHRTHKSFDLVSFEGYENINDIEKMKGGILKIQESQLVELEEDEFYYHEIIGCTVYNLAGDEIGKVREILTPGANDVWVIKGRDNKDILIPYIEDVVKKVDIIEKTIIIDPIEGLLS